MMHIAPLSEKQIFLNDLRKQEFVIWEQLQTEPKLIDGKLDYSGYDKLMSQLREVRAEAVLSLRQSTA